MNKRKIGYGFRFAIIAILVLSFPGTALADGGDGGYSATANGYQITLVFSEPAQIGVNEFHILISDSMGMPVPNANVEVTATPVEEVSAHAEEPTEEMHGMEMPTVAPATGETDGMAGMDMSSDTPSDEMDMNSIDEDDADAHEEEPIRVSLGSGHEPGEYSGEIVLDASGGWTISVHFTIGDQMTEVEIPIEVASTVSKPSILAGFFGINATMIAAAAIMRRKTTSK